MKCPARWVLGSPMHTNSNFRWRRASVSYLLLFEFRSLALLYTYIYIYIFTILLLLQMRHISGLGFRHGIRFDSSSSSTTLQLHSRNMSTDCGLLLHFPFDCSPHSPFPLAVRPTKQMANTDESKGHIQFDMLDCGMWVQWHSCRRGWNSTLIEIN